MNCETSSWSKNENFIHLNGFQYPSFRVQSTCAQSRVPTRSMYYLLRASGGSSGAYFSLAQGHVAFCCWSTCACVHRSHTLTQIKSCLILEFNLGTLNLRLDTEYVWLKIKTINVNFWWCNCVRKSHYKIKTGRRTSWLPFNDMQ